MVIYWLDYHGAVT